MNVTLGEIVYSKAGRDSGKKFIIVGLVDSLYVYVSDGDLRRLEKPKKKKLRHLELTGTIIEALREKLINKNKITNAEVRRALAADGEEPEAVKLTE